MKLDVFSGKVGVLQRRLQTLRHQKEAASVRHPELSTEVLEELGTALEELYVAQAELQQQNEELIATRYAIEKQRQRYQELLEFAPDGYLVTDTQGMIWEANQAAATLLGVRQERLNGKPLIVYIAEADRKMLRAYLLQLHEQQHPRWEWEGRVQPRGGASFPTVFTVTPVHGLQGRIVALRWLLRDMTDRKKMEEALRTAHDELEARVREQTADLQHANQTLRVEIAERQRIEEKLRQAKDAAEAADRTKTEFLATMSHELRTPLHIILGYMDLVMENAFGGLTDAELDILQRVKRSAIELFELITVVLDVSRLEAGRLPIEIREVRIAALLDELQEETRELRERSAVDFVWQVEAELPSIHTDPEKLKMVLKNLIGNAAKFTEKGRITVMARNHNSGVEISTTDTGIGIPQKELLMIFDPFQQGAHSAEGRYKGTGLGLYIVKRTLTMLGGQIEVESEVGQGSTFRVWLPSLSEQEKPVKPT